jgi:hypothetical protein
MRECVTHTSEVSPGSAANGAAIVRITCLAMSSWRPAIMSDTSACVSEASCASVGTSASAASTP